MTETKQTSDRLFVRIPVTLKPLALQYAGGKDASKIWGRVAANLETTKRKTIRLVMETAEMNAFYEVITKVAQERVGLYDPAMKAVVRSCRRMTIRLWESGHKYDPTSESVVRTAQWTDKAAKEKKAKNVAE